MDNYKFICNISFWCDAKDADSRLDFLRKEILPALEPGTRQMQLGRLQPGGHVPSLDGQPITYSLRVCFASRRELDLWYADICTPILDDYRSRFGESGLCMATVLEIIDLKE